MDLFSRFRLLIVFVVAIPLAILFAVLWSLTDSHQSIEKTLAAVKEVRSLDEELERIQSTVVEAESAQRGFLLTGVADYLQPLDRARAQIPEALAQVEAATATTPQTHAQIGILKGLIDERMVLIGSSIERERAGDHAGALAIVTSGKGQETMEAIQLLIRSIRLHKQGELTAGRLELNRRLRLDSVAAGILACFDILFLGGIVFLVLRVLSLQRIATICAWSKTIRDKDEWITFEEYLRRKFGIATTHGISEEMAERLLAKHPERSEGNPPPGE